MCGHARPAARQLSWRQALQATIGHRGNIRDKPSPARYNPPGGDGSVQQKKCKVRPRRYRVCWPNGALCIKSPSLCARIMKRREMNSLGRSLCAYLSSRNNDIAGYWGIGMLCAASRRKGNPKFSFNIYPGQLLKINGCEITGSKVVTDKLVKFELDSIEGRLSFFEDGHYPDGAAKYSCGIEITITQGGRTGFGLSHVDCWPHDPSRESRRAGNWIGGLMNLLGFFRA